jgi:hydrogenase nickel incorporation protein HypA/HybF
MHEIGLMQQALDIALARATAAGAQRVHTITMRIGAESGVVPEVIVFAFDVATRGTIAEGAQLAIEDVALACFCAACGLEFVPQDALHECPDCHRLGAEVRRGHEFEIRSLDVS